MGCERSQLGEIHSGVPQWSVLGPHLTNGLSATFADETTFLVSNDDPNEAGKKLSDQLEKYRKWSNKWNIRVNAESQHIILSIASDERTLHQLHIMVLLYHTN